MKEPWWIIWGVIGILLGSLLGYVSLMVEVPTPGTFKIPAMSDVRFRPLGERGPGREIGRDEFDLILREPKTVFVELTYGLLWLWPDLSGRKYRILPPNTFLGIRGYEIEAGGTEIKVFYRRAWWLSWLPYALFGAGNGMFLIWCYHHRYPVPQGNRDSS